MLRKREYEITVRVVEYESPDYPWNTPAEIVEQVDMALSRELTAPVHRVPNSVKIISRTSRKD